MGRTGSDSMTNENITRREGGSCFDTNTSGPSFKANFSAYIQQPRFYLSLGLFQSKNSFYIFRQKLTPALTNCLWPVYAHKPKKPRRKLGTHPTPRNPPVHDVTRPRPRVTSYPLSESTVSPITQKPHQTKIEPGRSAPPNTQYTHV